MFRELEVLREFPREINKKSSKLYFCVQVIEKLEYLPLKHLESNNTLQPSLLAYMGLTPVNGT